ncbi:diaminopimelate epimerase [bacterium]|nr:diaminopimelate epimerase [bacterium]
MKFYKISGSGNTFMIINKLWPAIPSEVDSYIRDLCRGRHPNDADGLILMLQTEGADLAMVYFNRNGERAEMCGNGLRCLAYLSARKGFNNPIRIKTDSAILKAWVDGNRVKIQMPLPEDIKLEQRIEVGGSSYNYNFMKLGVPHCAIRVQDIDTFPVESLGRIIREDKMFFPEGTNVDFFSLPDDHQLILRTYERGVEGETMACGTGAAATALLEALRGNLESPVRVKVKSGEILSVSFRRTGMEFSEVFLEGLVEVLFEGEI